MAREWSDERPVLRSTRPAGRGERRLALAVVQDRPPVEGRGDTPGRASMATRALIGVVADTHGLLCPQALRRLHGVDRIVHAGDIGKPEVLAALEAVAPVTAVRGNNDRGAWARAIPETAVLAVGRYVLWLERLGPPAAG